MARFGLAIRLRRHPHCQARIGRTRSLEPNFSPGRSGNRLPYTACGPVTAGLPDGIYTGQQSPITLTSGG